MNKLIFPFIVLVILSSCSSQSGDSGTSLDSTTCITQTGSAERRTELEGGIRGQVKFLGESENLSSITDKMSTYHIPALSLAVIHRGEIAWAETYTNPDFPEVQQLDCTSIFQAASLSKPVTFLAALRMQAAGVIDLDKDVQEYLQDFALPEGKQTATHPVTLRNLFSHTSGITPGGYQGYAQDLDMPSDLAVLEGRPGVNSPAIEVVTVPDETLAYSGGGYTLAEVALQDHFGEEFSNIMQQWILEPAGMQYSEFTQPLPASRSSQVARAYTATGEAIAGGWRNHPEQAAAGLWSNALDLSKFLIEIYNAYQGKSAIFSQSDIQSILSQERDGHVYGFLVNRSGDDIALTHYGGNEGYRTGMTISLSSGNGLVYLINSDNGVALGNELLLSASRVYNWQHFEQSQVTRKQVNADDLKPLAGEYKWNGQIDLSIRYEESDQQIILIFPNGDEYKMTPIVGDGLAFIHPNTGVELTFLTEDKFESFRLYGQTAVKLTGNAADMQQ
ncbi:serine hydrolase domain-containing protein [Flavilitoribacter nigricans]|uniref:Serine hydrolase n=1 Tax=Flavilitoribacter nigricans (strain ATCC 23147 / DSM 23189 / NBRC 102662 / NCIMB 1420 / SS-2) TaxID=1122177 RepID=A0A2D0NF57_FLAN2|nr:serine hydrolase domain-containing protein [Flavilitoribacter nigricans]PHN06996.1 serine hydrolase [Flavilitoribacter nigricans DSM 23189 = NBRC 102662]